MDEYLCTCGKCKVNSMGYTVQKSIDSKRDFTGEHNRTENTIDDIHDSSLEVAYSDTVLTCQDEVPFCFDPDMQYDDMRDEEIELGG